MTATARSPDVTFSSKVDGWIVATALGAGGACLATAGPMAWSSASAAEAAVLGSVVLLTLGLPVWLLLDTRYTITADEMQVRSGPFRWQIKLSEVRQISPSRSWLSSPALSLDRVRVQFGAARSVLVSPREKQQFVDCLRQRCPSVLVTGF